MNGDKLEWLKRIDLKIVRGGYVIREYVFNGFVADYIEYFNKGRHMFNLVIRQYKLKVFNIERLDKDYKELGYRTLNVI